MCEERHELRGRCCLNSFEYMNGKLYNDDDGSILHTYPHT